MNYKIDKTIFFILVTILFCYGIILIFQIFYQADLYFINKFSFGYDYKDFYNSSLLIKNGESPYQNSRYVTTPIPAIFNLPLTFLPFSFATTIVSVTTLIFIVVSMFIIHRCINSSDSKSDLTFLLMSTIIILFSYPFQFLFDRGNIDGIVLLFICVGIYFLNTYELLGGVFIALAICFKIYPIILVIPLLIHRRWKPVFYIGLSIIILMLLEPQLWMDFVQDRLFIRSSKFRIDENGSIANTFFYIGKLFNKENVFKEFSYIFYIILLSLTIFFDIKIYPSMIKEYKLINIVTYFPFMVAIPQLSYHYTLVCLLVIIPITSKLIRNSKLPVEKGIIYTIIFGIIISQFHAVAAGKIFNSILPHFIPGFGLLVVMIGLTVYKSFMYYKFKLRLIS